MTDAKEAYPKFVFSAIRPLTDAEADLVVAMRDTPQVTRILAEGSEHAGAAPAAESVFEQPPEKKVEQVFEQPPAPKVAAPVAKPAPVTPEVTTAPESDFEKALDAQLDALLS